MSGPGCTGCYQGCGYCTMKLKDLGRQSSEQEREAMRDLLKRAPHIGAAVTQSPAPDRLTQAANTIRERIKLLDQYKATYLAYLHDRITDADWHACWDVCVNLSEISCSRDEAVRALEAMGMEP